MRGIRVRLSVIPLEFRKSQKLRFLIESCSAKMIHHRSNWIDGQETPPSATTISVVNPATEEAFATINATPSEAVDEIITTSWKTFYSGIWSRKDPSDRFAVLSRASTLLRGRTNDFVTLETAQTGRPIREMRTQLARVPEWLDYFASLARVHEGRVTPFKGAVTNTLTRIPLGVVVLITPYNHPLLIAMKKIAAALAAGNVVIVKPSELAPLSVLKLGALFKEAGLPDGVLQIVSGYGRETGKYLCEHPKISKIDLTGGIATYRAIAPVAAMNMVPITAELGGKAPVCIFPSMDVETAVKAALFAGFIASGQTCVTGSRILVHKDIYDSFRSLLEKRVRALRVGNPTDEKTQIGSVISAAAIERCEAFVSRATAEGGTILCGGTRLTPTPEKKGYFFAPTVIETASTSDLANNEVFGPVLALIKCSDEDEIVQIANGTSYALGASVWSNDFTQAHRVADKIEAGIVWINGHHLNDPSSPWGGFKESGVGKENGVEAYESYTKVKSTVMNYGVKPVWFDDEAVDARYG
jgi:acyl-CoA reductase-like NAD-dependent aldehyde dehydrogenase